LSYVVLVDQPGDTKEIPYVEVFGDHSDRYHSHSPSEASSPEHVQLQVRLQASETPLPYTELHYTETSLMTSMLCSEAINQKLALLSPRFLKGSSYYTVIALNVRAGSATVTKHLSTAPGPLSLICGRHESEKLLARSLPPHLLLNGAPDGKQLFRT